jgi:hypothetical protein
MGDFFEDMGLEVTDSVNKRRRKPQMHNYHEATVYLKDMPLISRWVGIYCPTFMKIVNKMVKENGYEDYHGNVNHKSLGKIRLWEYYTAQESMARDMGILFEKIEFCEVPQIDIVTFCIADPRRLAGIFPDIDAYIPMTPMQKDIKRLDAAITSIDEFLNKNVINIR